MRRLLSKAEWLLVDEPQERDLFLAVLFLFTSWFDLAIALLDLYDGESILDDLVPVALVPMFLAWAALYALPTHRRRIMLWLRVVHALSLIGGLAMNVYSAAVNARSVWEPVAFPYGQAAQMARAPSYFLQGNLSTAQSGRASDGVA